MDRDKRPEPGAPNPPTPRHLDLAWSSPAPSGQADAALAAPDGATVPATWQAQPWPRVSPATDPDHGSTTQPAQAEPADSRRHLDLAWSSPAVPSPAVSWAGEEPAGATEGATVPESSWTQAWPRGVPDTAPEAEPDPDTSGEAVAPEGYYADTEFTDLPEFDELTFPKQGLPRSTWFLAVALLLVVAYGGGILTQKHHDTGLVNPAAAAVAQLQEAAAGGAAAPALTGTITAVSPTQITVRDATGKDRKVAVTDQTPIVKKVTAQNLGTGSQVVVQGTADADGTLHATAVVEP
jgi:hypothetical protein